MTLHEHIVALCDDLHRLALTRLSAGQLGYLATLAEQVRDLALHARAELDRQDTDARLADLASPWDEGMTREEVMEAARQTLEERQRQREEEREG